MTSMSRQEYGGKRMKFPNDADGDALQSLYKDGVNFKKQQSVEFFVAVPDKSNR